MFLLDSQTFYKAYLIKAVQYWKFFYYHPSKDIFIFIPLIKF